MAKTGYNAGFHFIVNTSDRMLNKQDRKAITSHATKTQWKRRRTAPLRSWIDPERSLAPANESHVPPEESCYSVSALKGVGGDFSALQLPQGIEPAMVQDLIKLIDIDRHGVYPYEICLRVHPVERGWFPYMLNDICCIHSMMYSVRAFIDSVSNEEEINRQAAFHYAKTLQQLQARVDAFGQSQEASIFSDATIIAVITLAMAAELVGDLATAQHHISGLLQMVNLRGGVRSLDVHKNMQIKVCRAELGLALRLGTPVHLFRDQITWDCFIADRGLIRCSHTPHEEQIHCFLGALDPKLSNCWKDVHAFCCLSNLTYQTTQKLSPQTYNEMMISVLYRLMQLSYQGDTLQETVRTALLTFCSTIFLTRKYLVQPYEHLFDLFGIVLRKLCQHSSIVVPKQVMLWLLMVSHMVADQKSSKDDWETFCLDQTLMLTELDTWPRVNEVLKSVMWVDFVHGEAGEKVFNTTIRHGKDAEAL